MPKPLAKPAVAAPPEHPWLAAFIDYLRSECHLAENSTAAYRRDMRRFLGWLAGRDLQKLSIRDLADYASWLTTQKLAPASVARHLVSLKIFFRYLQLEGVLRENLVELLGSPKLWQRIPQVLTIDQVNELLVCPRQGEPNWRRDRALVELLYATGCRASEVSHLRVRDVHIGEGYCLCRGKGDKERMVPLNPRAEAVVSDYMKTDRSRLAARAKSPPEWLLLSRRGRRLRRGT